MRFTAPAARAPRHDDGRFFTSEVGHGLETAPRHPAADGLDDAAALDAGPAVGSGGKRPMLDDADRLQGRQ